VSDEFLREAAGELRADYPGIDIHAVVGDFHRHLDRIRGRPASHRLPRRHHWNFTPEERRRFYFDLNTTMDP